MKVLLVNPPRIDRLSRRPSSVHEPPLGLAYVLSYLKAGGRDAAVLDCQAESLSLEQAVHRILATGAHYVGITAHTALVHAAAALSEALKQRDPSIKTILGGYHVTCLPEESLREFPTFDFGIYGEGETSLAEMLETVDRGRPLAGVEGLVLRENGAVRVNPPRPLIHNLDSLPLPMWHEFPLDLYVPHYNAGVRHCEIPLSTGRGCIGRCAMCARVTGERIRFRSIDNIFGEIEQDVFRYNARSLVFMDETFTAQPQRVEEICERLIREGYPKRVFWLCETRVNHVHRGLFRTMARAGCRHVSFGIESGNQEILDKLNKGITLAQARDAVRWAKEAGIIVDNFFIIGLPYETERTIRDTIRMALSLPSDFANFFIMVPYPGTKAMEMAKTGQGGLKLLSTDWRHYGIQMGKALELEGVPRSKLEIYQFLAYALFYFRPSRIRNMLKIVNPKMVPVYLGNILKGMIPRRPTGEK